MPLALLSGMAIGTSAAWNVPLSQLVPFETDTLTVDTVLAAPTLSTAVALIAAAPSATVVESHASSYGAVSSSTEDPSGRAKVTWSTEPSESAASADTTTSPL